MPCLFSYDEDEILSPQALKQTELNISHFFEWNLMFFTYYDFLEEFMSLGVLFENEKIAVPSTHGSGVENRAVINEATQNEDLDSDTLSY